MIQNGRAAEAGPVLDDALKRSPDNTRVRDNYAQLLLYRPETRARGMAFLEEETRRRPADFTPWVLLVEARLAWGTGPARTGCAGGIDGAHQSGGAAVSVGADCGSIRARGGGDAGLQRAVGVAGGG